MIRSTPTIHAELARADALWAADFGVGSRRELGAAYLAALEGPAAKDRARLWAKVEREHRERYGARALRRELEDERQRDAAVHDDAALVAYEATWSRRLTKLQRAYPTRWRLPGLSDEELKDELTLRLLDAVRSRPTELALHQRAGKAWGFLLLVHERRRLREGFRLNVELTDPGPLQDRAPTEEERWVSAETESLLGMAGARAEATLSRPQRRWLAAMKETADRGGFFASSGRLNLAAASRLLAKDRSSAQRAFAELQIHFARTLETVEAEPRTPASRR